MNASGSDRDVAWLEEVGLDDVADVGGKGANLGELIGAGLPVPGGYVVTAGAYRRAADAAGVRDVLATLRHHLAVDDPGAPRMAGAALTAAADKIDVTDDLAAAVRAAYHRMGPGAPVAVRSSATAEDAGDTSFAGMHTTYMWVRGDDEVLARVRDCWRSLYGDRVVAYRSSQRIEDEPAIAVVVQAMVDADRAGVAFTADLSTGDLGAIVVEAALGLGESVVSGQVNPDTYVVDARTFHVRSTRIGEKTFACGQTDDGGVTRRDLPPERRTAPTLSCEEVVAVAELAHEVAVLYGRPMDIEWAYAGPELWLLQARPITTLGHGALTQAPTSAAAPLGGDGATTLLRGLAAAPGLATGDRARPAIARGGTPPVHLPEEG